MTVVQHHDTVTNKVINLTVSVITVIKDCANPLSCSCSTAKLWALRSSSISPFLSCFSTLILHFSNLPVSQAPLHSSSGSPFPQHLSTLLASHHSPVLHLSTPPASVHRDLQLLVETVTFIWDTSDSSKCSVKTIIGALEADANTSSKYCNKICNYDLSDFWLICSISAMQVYISNAQLHVRTWCTHYFYHYCLPKHEMHALLALRNAVTSTYLFLPVIVTLRILGRAYVS